MKLLQNKVQRNEKSIFKYKSNMDLAGPIQKYLLALLKYDRTMNNNKSCSPYSNVSQACLPV